MNSLRDTRRVVLLVIAVIAVVVPACGPGTSVSVGAGVAYPGVGMGVAYPGGYWPGSPVGGVCVGGPAY